MDNSGFRLDLSGIEGQLALGAILYLDRTVRSCRVRLDIQKKDLVLTVESDYLERALANLEAVASATKVDMEANNQVIERVAEAFRGTSSAADYCLKSGGRMDILYTMDEVECQLLTHSGLHPQSVIRCGRGPNIRTAITRALIPNYHLSGTDFQALA